LAVAAIKRIIAVPKGVWKTAEGKIIKGSKMMEVNADINTLPI
jgi:hypothetical protein